MKATTAASLWGGDIASSLNPASSSSKDDSKEKIIPFLR